MVRGAQGWGRQGARQAQTTLRMPRFSDIFVYSTAVGDCANGLAFGNCFLLKQVGEHRAGTRISEIHFDVQGMVLFFRLREIRSGPYVLTTMSGSEIPATPIDA